MVRAFRVNPVNFRFDILHTFRQKLPLRPFDGAPALRQPLHDWQGGRLAVHVCEMPIKCPIVSLELAFLADW